MKDNFDSLLRDTQSFVAQKKEEGKRILRHKETPKRENAPTLTRDLSGMQKSLQTLAPHLKMAEAPAPIVFFTFDDRTFLETVAKATEELFGPCAVVQIRKPEELLAYRSCKLLIGPLPEHYSTAHQLTTLFGMLPFLPLVELKNYSQDLNLKRTLWQALKTIRSMPQFSSTAPSTKR